MKCSVKLSQLRKDKILKGVYEWGFSKTHTTIKAQNKREKENKDVQGIKYNMFLCL